MKDTFISRQHPEPWSKYPVIRLNFLSIASFSAEAFRTNLIEELQEQAWSNGIHLNDTMYIEEAVEELIEGVSNKHGSNVVILVDEYDASYTENYPNEAAPEILKGLQSFFTALKSQLVNIHFLLCDRNKSTCTFQSHF